MTRARSALRRMLPVGWLALVWVALWGELRAPELVAGVMVGAGLVTAFRFPPAPGPRSTVRPLAALHFLGYFAWKLLEASAIVAWEVVTPRNRITEGIIAVPLRGTSDALATLVANCVTLTPGTITIEFAREPSTLYVHVLHLLDVERVRADVMRLEELAMRAFAPQASRAALAREGNEDS